MDSFNFLNKKYSSHHSHQNLQASSNNNQSLAQSRSSKASMVHTHQYASKMPHSPRHVNQMNPSSSAAQLVANYCSTHSQQLIRHMCLDCIELLCSECVGDHISVHKQSRSFPTINTLKQIKSDMHVKLSEIMQLMFEEKNHPKNINSDIDKVRQESSEKLEALRKQMIDTVNEWIEDLKNSIMNNVGYEQIQLIKQQMYGLHEEINSLNNSLIQNNMNVQAIKKAYQIDANKLRNTYKQMADKYRSLSDTMKIDIQFHESSLIEALQKSISLKVGKKNSYQEVIKVDEDDEEGAVSDDYPKQVYEANKNNFTSPKEEFDGYQSDDERQNPLILYNFPPGSTTLTLCNISNGSLDFAEHTLDVSSYPLNSVAILPNNMLVISGGMLSEDLKSNSLQLIDYENNQVLSSMEMRYGRSSHKSIVYHDKIFIVGGFCSETSECKLVQIVTGDGIVVSPYQCKWGGPNLSIIYRNKLMKVTLTAVECMNLETLQWQQILSDVPFNLSKHMQIQKLKGKIYIFGDDNCYYVWNEKQKSFSQFESKIELNNINSSIVFGDKILAWINSKDIVEFDGQTWKWLE